MRKNQSFPVVDVAFEGFRLLAAHPATALMWVMVLFAGEVGLSALMVFFGAGAEVEITRFNAISAPTLEDYTRFVMHTAPLWILFIVNVFVLNSIVGASIIRQSLYGRRNKMGTLQFGIDELRFIGLFMLHILLFAFFGLIMFTIVMFLGAISKHFGDWILPILFILSILLILFILINAIRMILSYPIIVAEKKITINAAVIISKNKGMSLFFAYVIVYFLYAIISIGVGIVLFAILGISGMNMIDIMGPLNADELNLSSLVSVKYIATTFFSCCLSVFYFSISLGAATEAYRVLTNKGAEQVF